MRRTLTVGEGVERSVLLDALHMFITSYEDSLQGVLDREAPEVQDWVPRFCEEITTAKKFQNELGHFPR